MPRYSPNRHNQRTVVVALTLFGLALSALGLALARGSALHENGPLVRYGLPVGLLCFAVMALIAVRYRRWLSLNRGPATRMRINRLHNATGAILAAGAILVPILLVVFSQSSSGGKSGVAPPPTATPVMVQSSQATVPPGFKVNSKPFHLHLELILITLGVLLALVLAALIWRRLRLINLRLALNPITAPEPPEPEPEDEQALADAMSAGRRALDGDDARAAIIACYAAMEESLAAAGVARGRADSPAELLARALAGGVLRGPGPAALTGLFREARFSTHPMGAEQLEAARAALEQSTEQLRDARAVR
jgi:uncharacterized membrane protein YidH (DUF202 family)